MFRQCRGGITPITTFCVKNCVTYDVVASHPSALSLSTHIYTTFQQLLIKYSSDPLINMYGFMGSIFNACVRMDALCMWKHTTVRTHVHSGSHTPRRHTVHTVNQLIYQFSMFFFKSCMNSAFPQLSLATVTNPAQHIPVLCSHFSKWQVQTASPLYWRYRVSKWA